MCKTRAAVGAFTAVLFCTCAANFAAIFPPTLPVFGPATPVTELNSTGFEFPAWVSPDGKEFIFASDRGGSGYRMFSATRATGSGPFSAISQADFTNVNGLGSEVTSAVMSISGLELFFGAPTGATTPRFFRATRTSTAQPFTNIQQLSFPPLDTSPNLIDYLSEDGLRLYYWSGSSAKFVMTRPNVASSFNARSSAPFVNMPPFMEDMAFTPDELQMFYTNGDVLWWTWRPDFNTPFAPGQLVTSIGPLEGAVSYLSGNTIYFLRGDDIYQATSTTPLPEPAIGGVAALLGLVIATRLDGRRRRHDK
jgi:hypothetical protein